MEYMPYFISEQTGMRYNMPLSDPPSQYACGDRFSIGYALSCKKEGNIATQPGLQ